MIGDDDILGDVNPNIEFDLDYLSLKGPGGKAGQATSGVTHQKPVSAHRTCHRVRREHEDLLLSNLMEHV